MWLVPDDFFVLICKTSELLNIYQFVLTNDGLMVTDQKINKCVLRRRVIDCFNH